jgi:hypothetical protein
MSTGNTIPAQTCEDCGIRFAGSAYYTSYKLSATAVDGVTVHIRLT